MKLPTAKLSRGLRLNFYDGSLFPSMSSMLLAPLEQVVLSDSSISQM